MTDDNKMSASVAAIANPESEAVTLAIVDPSGVVLALPMSPQDAISLAYELLGAAGEVTVAMLAARGPVIHLERAANDPEPIPVITDDAEAAFQWHLARVRELGCESYCVIHACDAESCPPGTHTDG